jgi:PPOX class probable FMN-dependent enzyme
VTSERTPPVADADRITSLDALHERYHQPVPASLTKELDHLSEHYRRFVELSPFVVLASAGPDGEGLDCSPRGDANGFVHIVDERTVMLADRRGNNRLDSLRNIVRDPRVALLFLLPGIGETLRINGRAALSTNAELCESFTVNGKVPACVIVITIDRVYTQCPKALIRSDLWNPDRHLPADAVASTGTRMAAHTNGEVDAEAYDAEYPKRIEETIY